MVHIEVAKNKAPTGHCNEGQTKKNENIKKMTDGGGKNSSSHPLVIAIGDQKNMSTQRKKMRKKKVNGN